MIRAFAPALIVALAFGCTADSFEKDGNVPDIEAGKTDGSLEIVDNGPLTFGMRVTGSVEEGLAQSWTFELTEPGMVTFETSHSEGTDTVLYLQDMEENEIGFNDDGGEGYLSLLNAPLDVGTYRIVVGGYYATEGPFNLSSLFAVDTTTTCSTSFECGAGEVCVEGSCMAEGDDPWALAKNVNLHHVEFTESTPIPESFTRAQNVSPISLSSPEWWQRWSGGATQSFTWSEGTDYGKRCGQASAIRLQAIYETAEGRAAFDALREGSNWRGTMYNWTEDISMGGRASFSPATMWAWRTTAIKWINVVHPDGSCDLPTLELVQRYSETCLEQASREDGEIQGCLLEAR